MSSFERITSKDNDVVKLASRLISDAKSRKQYNSFVLDGLRLCRDAIYNDFPVEVFIVGESAYEKARQDAEALSSKAKKSYLVPDYIISKISDTVNPQGFICICKKKGQTSFLCSEEGLYIALENTADPSNLGAIARTAEALGIDGILISSEGCDPYNPKALRASMGALLRIPVFVVSDFVDYIKNSKLDTYASVVDNKAKSVREVCFKKGSIVLIGNEANGLTSDAVSVCDEKITIRMSGKSESLNAAAAAAILIWEMSQAI